MVCVLLRMWLFDAPKGGTIRLQYVLIYFKTNTNGKDLNTENKGSYGFRLHLTMSLYHCY